MKKLLIYLLLAATSLVSCNKDDGDNEPADPVTGQIAGKIVLADEFGVPFTVHSGVKVTAKTYYYDISDGGGNYQVNNLTPGYYDLTFEKNGFGTFKKFNIGVVENATTEVSGIDSIGQQSTTLTSNLSISWNASDSTYSIGCTLNPQPSSTYPRSFRLFFGKTPAVSYQNYLFTPAVAWTAITATGVITGFEPAEFYNNGFYPGDIVYAVAYGEAMITNTYTDPVTLKKVFPNINSGFPSNVFSFILP
jgi:hypothetical protein